MHTGGDLGNYADADIFFGKKTDVSCVSCNLLEIEGRAEKYELAQ